jgi:hypothetical protein
MLVLGRILLVMDVNSDCFHCVVVSGRKLEIISILFDSSDIGTSSGFLELCDIFPSQTCSQAFQKGAVTFKASSVVVNHDEGPSVAS